MTHDQPHHEHAQDAFIDALFEQSPMNVAALLRACADGELNPEQCKRLEEVLKEHPHPEADSQRAFEQKLRACCSRSMSNKPLCPQSLRERVGAIAAESRVAADAESDAYAQRIEDAGAYTKDQSFWSRAPLMTAAAVLLLGVAGVMIWQSSALFSNQGITNPTPQPVSYIEHLGKFMMGEHKRYCIDEAAAEQFAQTEIDSAISYFSERFERDVQIPDLVSENQTLEFFGGGDCYIPRTPVSGHLRFDTVDADGEPIVFSLFVAPDSGELQLEEGVTYLVNAKACDEAGARLFVWVHEGVQYFLVSEAHGSTCGAVRGLMKAPETMGKL